MAHVLTLIRFYHHFFHENKTKGNNVIDAKVLRHTTLVILYIVNILIYAKSMLRDALSNGIRVGSHLIKECAWQLKADSSVKGLQFIMNKNQEVAEEYSKNRRRLLRNHFFSLKVDD